MSAKQCPNCHSLLHGPVCHQCGQKYRRERWTVGELVQSFIAQLTNIEKGFLHTGIELLKAPQKIIHGYWKGQTIQSYNPFRYVLIWTAINLIISFSLGFDDLLQEHLQPDAVSDRFSSERIEAADAKFDTWLNALVLLLLPVFALVTKYLFQKAKRNYAEHLIMNAFIMGQQALITSFTQFLFYLFPALFSIYLVFNFAVGLTYNSFVFRKVFEQPWWLVVAKAFVIGVVGILVFFLIIAAASAVALLFS